MKRFELDESRPTRSSSSSSTSWRSWRSCVIQKELEEKRAEAKQHRGASSSRQDEAAGASSRDELAEMAEQLRRQAPHQDRRRRRRGRSSIAEAFIVDEDANVVAHARRLGQARARAEGSVGRPACARATRCWRCCAGSTQERRSRSSRTSAPPTSSRSTTCRRRPATASRCRSSSSSTTASASSARCRSIRAAGRAQESAGRRRHASSGFGLRFALAPHTRALDARRPPLRQAGRGRRDRRRRARAATSDIVVRASPSDAHALALQGRARSTSWPARAAASRSSRSTTTTRVVGFASRGAQSDEGASSSRREGGKKLELAPGTYEVTRARRQGRTSWSSATRSSSCAPCRQLVPLPSSRRRS